MPNQDTVVIRFQISIFAVLATVLRLFIPSKNKL